jgi:hypothetical protein
MHPFFIHSCLERHFGCFQVLVVINKVAKTAICFIIAHSFHMDLTSNIKTLQDLFLQVVAFGNVWPHQPFPVGSALCELCGSKKPLCPVSEPPLIWLFQTLLAFEYLSYLECFFFSS